ncbi:MAG: hypothetical protein A4E53_02388 [Pelotomaculum sp. PtaB.Bin104]|nr:MAG: hypothetical protein A4E53_02388 [Pelotomaculum sp. PtaB.Bin104]
MNQCQLMGRLVRDPELRYTQDLTPEDVFALKAVAAEISQEIIAQLNLLIEWEDRYKLGLLDIFRQKNNRQAAI